MEESQGHEGKYASGEGQGGRVFKKQQQNSVLIRVSWIEAAATQSCCRPRPHPHPHPRKGRRAWSQGHVPIALRAKEELGRGW